MIIVAGFIAVLATVPLAGGSLSAMTRLRLRGAWLLIIALVGQTLLVSVFERQLSGWVGQALHLATYALAAAFFVVNRRTRGLTAVGFGGLLNLVAIVANGGVMPASAWAVRTSGLVTSSTAFANSRALAHPRLLVFGDIFAVPSGWPLANVFSIGDVVLLAGAFYTAHAACGTRWARTPAKAETGESAATADSKPGNVSTGATR